MYLNRACHSRGKLSLLSINDISIECVVKIDLYCFFVGGVHYEVHRHSNKIISERTYQMLFTLLLSLFISIEKYHRLR